MRLILLALTALITPPVAAQQPDIGAGEYLTEGGWGTLTISKNNNKTLFKISTVGANAHSCSLEGELIAGKATIMNEVTPAELCQISFLNKANMVTITNNAPCRNYCGYRATFDGDYFKPPEGCANAEQNRRRKAFKALYDQRQYAAALKESQSLLQSCGNFMGWIEKQYLYNDNALTQYHLKDKVGCLSTLKLVDFGDDLKNLPPFELEMAQGITKAKQTNLKLCEKLK